MNMFLIPEYFLCNSLVQCLLHQQVYQSLALTTIENKSENGRVK